MALEAVPVAAVVSVVVVAVAVVVVREEPGFPEVQILWKLCNCFWLCRLT